MSLSAQAAVVNMIAVVIPFSFGIHIASWFWAIAGVLLVQTLLLVWYTHVYMDMTEAAATPIIGRTTTSGVQSSLMFASCVDSLLLFCIDCIAFIAYHMGYYYALSFVAIFIVYCFMFVSATFRQRETETQTEALSLYQYLSDGSHWCFIFWYTWTVPFQVAWYRPYKMFADVVEPR